jgi:DNA-directed RNA polymerase specialized sigma24 family protein
MTGGGSFEEFYTGAVSRLLGHLFLVTGDLHEAEEVVQEAFARCPWPCESPHLWPPRSPHPR